MEENEEVEGEGEEVKGPKRPKFPITMFISEGNKYNRIGELKSAIQKYNEALEQEPNNVLALIGRAQCYTKQGLPVEARADAEAALKANPRCVEAKAIIGGTEYLSGDFEQGFITCYRTHVVRPNNKEMKVGYQMCQKAIENTLYPDDSTMRFDNDDHQELAASEGRGKPATVYKEDARFLKSMLSDEAYESVHPKCQDLLDYINGRRAFWRFQNPDVQKKKKKEPETEEDDLLGKEGPPIGGGDSTHEMVVVEGKEEEEEEEEEEVEVIVVKEDGKRKWTERSKVKGLSQVLGLKAIGEERVEGVESQDDLSPSPSMQGSCFARFCQIWRKKKKDPPKK